MYKEEFKQEQPIAYQTLSNALLNHKLAHAYIFSGMSGTPKKECAILLTQSILCTHPDEFGFACETCDECLRIQAETFSDMIVLDGSQTSIKKDQIIKLQQKFVKTGLEHTGKKIYILNRAENATPDALNSLLKFLEEPGSDTMAILLVEQMDRLLPTIRSRCQNIPFHTLSWLHYYEMCKNDMDELDAYLLSNMVRSKKQIDEIYTQPEYSYALTTFQKFVDEFLISPYFALTILIQTSFEDTKKRNGKISMQYFLEMMMTFYKDILQGGTKLQSILKEDAWYIKQIVAYEQRAFSIEQLLEIVLQTRDKLLQSVNISLLCDQLVYKMKEVTK